MRKYNVAYDAPDGTRIYCLQWSDLETMQRVLRQWQELYGINGGKKYPNGKGFYPFSNPRIVSRKG